MGHKNMEALRKLQKNQGESLPVHSKAKVFPYTTVNPERLMEYVPSERADGDGFSEFAKGCRPGGRGRKMCGQSWMLATFFMSGFEVELGL